MRLSNRWNRFVYLRIIAEQPCHVVHDEPSSLGGMDRVLLLRPS